MKFRNDKKSNEIYIDTSIESDGCAIVNVNHIGVLRFLTDGRIVRICNSDDDCDKLKKIGFKVRGQQVDVDEL